MAAKGSIPGDELPQIIEIEAVGAIEVLLLNLSFTPTSAASGQAPRSSASIIEALFASLLICSNILLFHTLAITDSMGIFCAWRNE